MSILNAHPVCLQWDTTALVLKSKAGSFIPTARGQIDPCPTPCVDQTGATAQQHWQDDRAERATLGSGKRTVSDHLPPSRSLNRALSPPRSPMGVWVMRGSLTLLVGSVPAGSDQRSDGVTEAPIPCVNRAWRGV